MNDASHALFDASHVLLSRNVGLAFENASLTLLRKNVGLGHCVVPILDAGLGHCVVLMLDAGLRHNAPFGLISVLERWRWEPPSEG